MRYVGIDPGQQGALVVVGDDGLTVVDRLGWAGCVVAPALPVLPGDVVALELPHAQFVRAGLVLAEWCGGALVQLRECRVVRPSPAAWRGKVLRRPQLLRAAAKRAAREAATPYLGPATDDECEAWCMARYAFGWATFGPGRQL